MSKPFLWNFIEKIEKQRMRSDAREKATESANEETQISTVKLDE